MEKEAFDYAKVPHNFGLCATADCPHADTCLRRIAYTYTPASITFPPTLNPKTIEAMAGKCEYYRSNKKVHYAKDLSAPRKHWLLVHQEHSATG